METRTGIYESEAYGNKNGEVNTVGESLSIHETQRMSTQTIYVYPVLTTVFLCVYT